MKTFTLRANLSSPLIRQGYMTLDALVMAIEKTDNVSNLIYQENGLYFASAAQTDIGAFSESASFVAGMRPETMFFEWNQVLKEKQAIDTQRMRGGGNIISKYKSVLTPFVEWHATGNPEAVFDVVKNIPFVGKRRASGFGQVKSWELLESELDGISGYADEPMRPVPVEMWKLGGDWIPMDAAWKGPYWDVRNRAKCFVPMEA